ncbi:hypothetical protein [Halomonas sp. AOP35-4E-18]|uniref:hypothetical protein n=1 Tax=Halomonas sp. AOP35-4E-18 TaxID=3457686 RepID=UPI00403393C6
MDFNPHVLLLFANAFLTTALSVVVVGAILIREYRPTIRRLKKEQAETKIRLTTTASSDVGQ